MQSDCICVFVGIVGLSHVRAKQCTSTPSLWELRRLSFWIVRCLISCLKVA